MSRNKAVPQASDAKSKSTKSKADELACVITDIDCMSQQLDDEVIGIADLALTAIKSLRIDSTHPESKKIVRGITQALRLIQYHVGDTMNSINGRAEDVGYNYKEHREVANG